MELILEQIRSHGAQTLSSLRALGKLSLFVMDATMLCFHAPFKWKRIVEEMFHIGVKSVFVVCLTAFFTGMVLGLQGYYTLSRFGSEGLLGGAVALTLIRELGPVLTALMVTGRAGSFISSELGSMRISEQIDALYTMNINPIKYLVSPKIIAAVLAVPLLTAIGDMVGIFGGYITGVVMLDLNSGVFINNMISSTDMSDVVNGLIKPVFFGYVLAAISSYRGFFCDSLRTGGKGSEAVSTATTSSVVISSVTILISDYILTAFLM
ncbi:MAG: ABC transporter permease [Candidatus Aureabacteria bacterium]|nr:ABC transporter permease [Candidatus Auribacterota bacterium]